MAEQGFQAKCTQVEFDTVVRLRQPQTQKQNLKAVGNRVSVIDNGNRRNVHRNVMEQFTAGKVLPVTATTRTLFDSSLLKYVDTTVKGHNLLVLSLGTTTSGKQTVLLGNKAEQSVPGLFLQSLYASIDMAVKSRNSKKQSMTYDVKAQIFEIVEQKITDLLSETKYSALQLQEDTWQGIVVDRATWVPIKNISVAQETLQKGFKNRLSSLNELGDSAGKSTCILVIEITQKYVGGEGISSSVVSRVIFCQLPGLEVMKNSQQEMRIKEQNMSIRSLVGFCSVVKHLAQGTETPPLYESSKLTHYLKDYLGGNAFGVAILTVANGDPEGSLKTLKFIKNLSEVPQYPIFNNGQSVGLLHKMRIQRLTEKVSQQPLANLDSEKQILETNLKQLRSEDDYKRILTKYTELKDKYGQAMKSKNEIQLELIRSEEEKLQISKNLVQLQIENTRLVEQLQGKDYQMGRKLLKAETSMIEKEVATGKQAERIKELEESVQRAIDAKRQLQIEFIALKKNYITQQKELQQLRKDKQALGLDLINMNNQNKVIEGQIAGKNLKGSQSADYLKNQLDQLQKQKQKLQENQQFLKSQIERYREQVVQYELSMRQNNMDFKRVGTGKSSSSRNQYRQLQLQNEKIELTNRVKLLNRRIDQLQEMNQNLNEDFEELRNEQKQLAELQASNTLTYRQKLEKVAQKDTNLALTELKASFNNVEKKSKEKLQEAKKNLREQIEKGRNLTSYARELKQFALQYAPKGIPLPTLLTTEIDNNNSISSVAESSQMEKLKAKNKKLEQELSMIRAASRQGSSVSNDRLVEQINYLKASRAKEGQSEQLRNERNELKEENRKLMAMLKDGGRMETTTLVKQNELLKKQLQRYKDQKYRENKDSISPNSNDQRLQYYEKHLKKLQKERSQLLVRCTVAQEQLRTFQEHFAKKR